MSVLARILLPEIFGLVAMVTALTGFIEMFKDLGLSAATIQRKEITHAQVSALFWINTCVGIGICLLISASSFLIARFYGDPRLVHITIALSIGFIFGGMTVQHQALLRRQLRFGTIAWVQVVSTLMGILVAVGMALKGYGYWALVAREVIRNVFLAAGTILMSRWIPGLPAWGTSVRSLLRFGGDITGYNIVWYASRSIDQILIGKYAGAATLGLYRQSAQLMDLPINQLKYPVLYVGEPALSSLQNDRSRYRAYYAKLVSVLAFASMPLVVYLWVYAEPIIRILLGDKWIGSVVFFKILALPAFIQPVLATTGAVMITSGQSRRYFYLGLANALTLVLALGTGIRWGATGVVIAYTIHTYALLIPTIFYSFRGTHVDFRLFLDSIRLPIVSSFFMGVLLTIFLSMMSDMNLLLNASLSLLVAGGAYLGFWAAWPGARPLLKEYLTYPSAFLKGGDAGTSDHGR